MSDSYLKAAFEKVCEDAKPAGGFFVCLMESAPRYGGPEEGGWWTSDTTCVAYKEYPTETAADAAKAEVEKLAAELSKAERDAYGNRCLRETEWLDARGLDDSFLPEPDGPTEYSVIVADAVPSPSYGPTYYE